MGFDSSEEPSVNENKNIDDEILRGNFSAIPPEIPSEIRIFLSSTFSDFYIERNYLIEHVYDDLRKYCLEEYQKDFILIDMRWGITEEIENQQMTTNICLDEIEKCRKQSMGPFFVALLSHRYGTRTLLPTLNDEEFKCIKNEVEKDHVDNIELLKTFYEIDENSIQNKRYNLKKITQITESFEIDKRKLQEKKKHILFNMYNSVSKVTKNSLFEEMLQKHFGSLKEHLVNVTNYFENNNKLDDSWKESISKFSLKNEDEIEKELAKTIMEEKKEELTYLMRKAADRCFSAGKLDKVQRNFYFNSITAFEIHHGMLQHKEDSNLRSFVIFRELKNMCDGKNSTKFFEHDPVSTSLLNELKDEVKKCLSSENQSHFYIDWMKTNEFEVNENTGKFNGELENYLTEFGSFFSNKIKSLLELAQKSRELQHDVNYEEVLHHARYCKNLNRLAKNYVNKFSITEQILAYLSNEEDKPFIIAGPSGAGKTSMIAAITNMIREKIPDSITIIRFMGTSKHSSSMKSILNSIIKQLDKIYGQSYEEDNVDSENEMVKFNDYQKEVITLRKILLKKLVNILQINPKQKIIILLDSIDQLSKQDHSLDWICYKLPKNVKIIYSVLSNYKKIFDKLKKNVETNYCEINNLELAEAKSMLMNLLNNSNRQLTPTQWHKVKKLLENTAVVYPLHIKLLFDISSKWTSSYDIPEEFNNCLTIKDTIKYLFSNLEKKYGEILFSHCIFYLTLFDYKGISESELEDIMSIDDDVLTSVFLKHHPPVRGFPIALWLNIKYELKDYITKKETDGISVISWFHSTFIEASQEYCKSKFQNPQQQDAILMNVIDYFTEKWNHKKSNGTKGEMKEFEYKKSKLKKFLIKNETPNRIKYMAYRNTKSQKLKFKLENETIYNKRKLNELINVIMMLNDEKEKINLLKEHIYFNYEFMLCKAELHEMDFVIDAHKKLYDLNCVKYFDKSNLEIKELVEISEIYLDEFRLIENKPDLLLIKVLSRLESRSDFVRAFAGPCHLFLLDKLNEKHLLKDLYYPQDWGYVKQYYPIHDAPYLLVQTKNYGIGTRLCLINSKTKVSLGQIELPLDAKSLQIIIYDNFENLRNISRISDLDGDVYFFTKNVIYSSYFNNEVIFVQEFQEQIKKLLLLNENNIVVFFMNKIVLLKVRCKSENKIEQIVISNRNDEIEIIKSTLPEFTVYSSSFLGDVDFITIIVALKNKCIQIFQFDKNTEELTLLCSIDSLNWSSYGYGEWGGWKKRWRESLIIDEVFLVDNKKCFFGNRNIIRFAVEEMGVVKIIDVKNCEAKAVVKEKNYQNEFDKALKALLDDFYDSDEEFNDLDKFELISLHENKLILSLSVKEDRYIFSSNSCDDDSDIEINIATVDVPGGYERIFYVPKINLLGSDTWGLEFYDFKPSNANKNILRSNSTRNLIIKENSLRVVDDKLIALTADKLGSTGLSLIEIDYLSLFETNQAKNSSMEIHDIYCQLDTKHILAQAKKGSLCELLVIDVTTKNTVRNISGKHIASNPNYIITAINESPNNLLKIHRIDRNQASLCLNELFKLEISTKSCYEALTQVVFDECNSSKLMIIFFYKNDSVEIRFVEDDGSNQCKYEKFIVNINKVLLDRSKIRSTITSLNDYLVIWEEKKEGLYFIDIKTNEIIIKMIAADCVLKVSNTNSLIILMKEKQNLGSMYHKNGSIHLLDFDKDRKLIDLKTSVFEYVEGQVSNIKTEKDYLIVRTVKNTVLYKIDDLVKYPFAKPIVINKFIENYSCISTDKKYFILFTSNLNLCVYILDDIKDEPFACFKLDNSIYSLSSSEKFISAIIYARNKLLTFEIID